MSEMEYFQAVFYTFCMNNRESKKIDIDTLAIVDNELEEPHVLWHRKYKRKPLPTI